MRELLVKLAKNASVISYSKGNKMLQFHKAPKLSSSLSLSMNYERVILELFQIAEINV